jgi:hypothetical protein
LSTCQTSSNLVKLSNRSDFHEIFHKKKNEGGRVDFLDFCLFIYDFYYLSRGCPRVSGKHCGKEAQGQTNQGENDIDDPLALSCRHELVVEDRGEDQTKRSAGKYYY